MKKTDLISIRELAVGDEAFILSTWLKGLLFGGDNLYRRIPKAIYFKNHHAILEKILAHPATTVKLAVLKEDADVILGYSVYRVAGGQTVLDWTFVKKEWRGIGIAKSLCPENVYAVTNLTRVGGAILEKHPNTIYNPYL